MRAVPPRPATEIAELRENADLTRRDWWLLAPILAGIVVLPLAIVTVVSVSLWFAARGLDLSVASPAPTTFASRWPDAAPSATLIR
jgi:hypothetical protein